MPKYIDVICVALHGMSCRSGRTLLLWAVFGFCTMVVITGCAPTSSEARHEGSNDVIKVVATTGMIADVLREVGKGRVEVFALMGPGVDPHAYRQTRADIAAMTAADAVFWHGLYLEAQLEDFFKTLSANKPVYPLAESVDKALLLSHEDYANRYDPHIWMAPRLWLGVVEAARDALTELDPGSSELYAANADNYKNQIEELADYSEEILATVPENERVLVTAHDAFRYFGREYGFTVLGIQGISTESETSLRKIEDIVSTLVSRKIGAIFVESSVSDRNVMALVEGAKARGHAVKVGGELFSDAMGAPGTYEGTYLGMIDHNFTLITLALKGHAPMGGLHGRLKCC